jgi:biopolymer transport protein ExbD
VQTKSGVTVTVDASRTISIGDTKMQSLDQFKAAFPTFIKGKEKQGVNFTADKSVDWEFVLKVMSAIQASGVTTIGAIGVPQETPR